MDDIIFERHKREKSLFNFVNPIWMISSLASVIFRVFGFCKRTHRSPEFDYLTNGLPKDYTVLKYPSKYSTRSIIPNTEISLAKCDSKCTQTEEASEDYIQSKLNSQIQQLVKLRKFQNVLKTSRKRVRRVMNKRSENFLKELNTRNTERFGGKVSKDRRHLSEKSTRALRLIKSKTGGMDVDSAMEDVFYIIDSDA